MSKLEVVTIDGPSGVGKSTISRKVAARLGFTYLDTGAMYRAFAFKCQAGGIDTAEEAALHEVIANFSVELLPAPSESEDVQVVMDGVNISGKIRTQEMSMLASAVSALKPVRALLTRMQQEIGAKGRIVAEGRDTGTVVFPAAAWKFYLDASPEERARRRVGQLREKGEAVDEREILNQIIKRDKDDSERTIAPLKAAPDAVHIDSTVLSREEVVERVLEVVRGGVFDVNVSKGGITWCGTYGDETRIEHTINDGDSVTLQVNGNEVEVVNIQQVAGDKYLGKINRFTPANSFLFKKLELGQQVEFKRVNIFTVSPS